MPATPRIEGAFHVPLSALLTTHASQRMSGRGLSTAAVTAALMFGRLIHVRGAQIHAVGRKEVEALRREGIDISRYEGVQAVCSPGGTAILTVYRNRDFRGLRPSGPRRRACRRRR